jgi:hypothetical protein
MVKLMILILSIIAISYAQDITDEHISAKDKERYYRILLNKWRESRDYRASSNCMNCMGMYEVFNMIEITLKKHYGIDSYKLCESVLVGEQGEYTLTVARELSDKDVARIVKESPNYNPSTAKRLTNNEQIWILYSEKLKKVVSTHKDKRQPQESTKHLQEKAKKNEAERVYSRFLENWNPGTVSDCPILWKWNQWKLNLTRRIRATPNGIDSATAVFIAINAAEECTGSKISFLAARPMGDNQKHWMIYCFPAIRYADLNLPDYCKRPPYCDTNYCNYRINQCYNHGFLFSPGVQADYCPEAIIVIVSRENGQVLYMTR